MVVIASDSLPLQAEGLCRSTEHRGGSGATFLLHRCRPQPLQLPEVDDQDDDIQEHHGKQSDGDVEDEQYSGRDEVHEAEGDRTLQRQRDDDQRRADPPEELDHGALAVGYVVYEIERRRRELNDVWDVLDEEDALLTEKLEEMVESGELQPYTGATLA